MLVLRPSADSRSTVFPLSVTAYVARPSLLLTVTSNAPLGDFTVTSLAWHRTVAASIIKKILFLIDMIILQGDT